MVQDDPSAQKVVVNADEVREFRVQHHPDALLPQGQGLLLNHTTICYWLYWDRPSTTSLLRVVLGDTQYNHSLLLVLLGEAQYNHSVLLVILGAA